MVYEGKGRVFKRKDGKVLIYVPKNMSDDSMFPFKDDSIHVKIRFTPGGRKELIVEEWKEPTTSAHI